MSRRREVIQMNKIRDWLKKKQSVSNWVLVLMGVLIGIDIVFEGLKYFRVF